MIRMGGSVRSRRIGWLPLLMSVWEALKRKLR